MVYLGIDYHKRFSFTTKMDEKGNILEQMKISNDRITLKNYLDRLPPDTKIALEATGNWYSFYELVEERDLDVSLAHPLKTRAIAEARIKTDKVDSEILAHLLRTNLLPTSYIPPRKIRDIREVLRYRASLVFFRTALKNKVHAIFLKNGINVDFSDIFGKKALKFLKWIPLRPCYRKSLDGYIKLAEQLNILIKEVEEVIKERVEEDPKALLLTTIPGISYYSALLIISEIGDINRFFSEGHLSSYGGLIPSIHSSGGKTRLGRITKQGSKWLRWILVENAHHAARGSIRFGNLYKRVAYRHGTKIANVAVAREMLKVIYFMLKRNEPFRDIKAKQIKDTGHLPGVMTRKRS